jgi:YbgC/YbaW family acyl-CoA thioester hydrolase
MPQAFTRDELVTATSPRFVEARVVRFQEVDAAGIVFYPRILEYFNDAWIAMLLAGGYDLPRVLVEGDVLLPLVHAEGDFLAPMRFGDAITVELVEGRAGGTSLTLGFRVRDAKGKVTAIGQSAHVAIARATFKPVAVPDEVQRIVAGS